MALHGSLATLRQQAPKTEVFATAFAYLEDLTRPGSAAAERIRGIATGKVNKVDLDHGVFALEQVYETKARADGFFESHRKYIDVQFVFEGEELLEVADISRMKGSAPYDESKDFFAYEDSADASLLRLFAGQAAIFFPQDVHMPTLRVRSNPVLVRKCVIKVPVG
jgi:biofilm protein TabA